MKLDFIPLNKLSVSKANMRFGKKAPDVSDILPTVRKRGVLQPLIVRTNCGPDAYEIVAGARRFHAASLVAAERVAAGDAPDDMLPCAIIEAGDDAAAIEASLIENIARLAPDDVTRWVTFTAALLQASSTSDRARDFRSWQCRQRCGRPFSRALAVCTAVIERGISLSSACPPRPRPAPLSA